MSTEVTLPALGESVTEGTVSRWLKQVGDAVETDEPLLEISTDKVDTEIPSPASGVLLEIKVNEDETVEVGAVLGVIGESEEATGDGDEPAPAAEPKAEPADEPEQQDTQNVEPQSDQAEPEQAHQQADQADAQASQADAEAQASQDDPAPAPSAGDAAGSSSGDGTEVTLPALGESVTEGTVSRWLKQVGDTVETDEALLEISTDKVDTEIPSPASGTLTEIRVNEDETVEVGAVLGVIGSADAAVETAPEPETRPEPEAKPEPEPEPEPAQPQAAPEPARQEAAPSAAPPGQVAPARADGADGQYLTPLVRKLAAEHDVDLSSLTGTGVGGRIRKQDVLAAAEEAKKAAATPEPAAQPAAAAAPTQPTPEAAALRGTTEKVSRLRATIARRMVESLQTSAQLTATVEVDLTKISRLRAKVKNDFVSREGVKLSYLPFITKAVAETLKVYPKVNARIDTEAGVITYSDAENVGIAVDTAKGLVVPVIRDAGDLNIAGLAKKIADLANRSRSSKLAPDDLAGGTFTITNYGSAGTLMDTPIINQPQVAILGTGALVKRPVVMSDEDLGDTIVIRDMMYLSLSYDHRLVDGADAARFLSALKQRLEEADFTGELGR